jgi:carbon storage regulator
MSRLLAQKRSEAMLVLSRKPGERILIGNDVKVTVIRIGPNSVRLGIDAPGNLNIVREELCLDPEKRSLGADNLMPESAAHLLPR